MLIYTRSVILSTVVGLYDEYMVLSMNHNGVFATLLTEHLH